MYVQANITSTSTNAFSSICKFMFHVIVHFPFVLYNRSDLFLMSDNQPLWQYRIPVSNQHATMDKHLDCNRFHFRASLKTKKMSTSCGICQQILFITALQSPFWRRWCWRIKSSFGAARSGVGVAMATSLKQCNPTGTSTKNPRTIYESHLAVTFSTYLYRWCCGDFHISLIYSATATVREYAEPSLWLTLFNTFIHFVRARRYLFSLYPGTFLHAFYAIPEKWRKVQMNVGIPMLQPSPYWLLPQFITMLHHVSVKAEKLEFWPSLYDK